MSFCFSRSLFFGLFFQMVSVVVTSTGFSAEGPPNVVFILSDDHRYDFMSFHARAPQFLETPNFDRLANEGAHFENAFVSTSLCSPSRASILTGRYMHHHRVVDNQRAVPRGTVFFPQHLRSAGFETAFFGKWHMGHENAEPRPGFDHWCSFKGQGKYFNPTLNINGRREEFEGYNADVLTAQAIQWLDSERTQEKPFFLYLGFKAVHYPFLPAKRHAGRYRDEPIDYPETMARTERNYRTQPRWVRERRNSIHGIDHMETGPFDKDPVPDFDALYHGYCEAVHSLDENVGRLLTYLDKSKLADETLVVYMGDNGFHLGEHGFYDKRDAYETSIRVPMLARGPGIKPGTKVQQMVQNIDIAPTLLHVAGIKNDAGDSAGQGAGQDAGQDAGQTDIEFDGESFWPLAIGEPIPWRDHILYEYHWEWNFPATPTLFAIRTDRYKFVYHHGVWDRDAFFDLETDPIERHNLIDVPAYEEKVASLRSQLFRELESSGALEVPFRTPAGDRLDQRKVSN